MDWGILKRMKDWDMALEYEEYRNIALKAGRPIYLMFEGLSYIPVAALYPEKLSKPSDSTESNGSTLK